MAPSNTADASPASALTKEASATTTQAQKARSAPPPESTESKWLRRAAILSFWAVVVLLGLPVWWKTTAIYRAELPLRDMTDWAEGKVSASQAVPSIELMLTLARSANQSSLYALPSKPQFLFKKPRNSYDSHSMLLTTATSFLRTTSG